MNYKPWSLIVLAALHFIEPIAKLLFYHFYLNVNAIDIFTNQYAKGSFDYLNFFEFFFLFPIAGIAILFVKRWSYIAFILIEVWVVTANFSFLKALYINNNFFVLSVFVFLGLLNIFVVGYLLVPAVRIAYMNPRVRWWEAKPRYQIDLKAMVNGTAGEIKNISQTGVFLTSGIELEIDSLKDLSFTYNDQKVELKARVIHKFSINNVEGYGVQFSDMDSANKKILKSIISDMENGDVPRRPERRDNIQDFLNWVKKLLTTGEGFVPKHK